MAISIGSVEVDIVPNTRGISRHLQSALVPAATQAGNNAGQAAGRAFGPAMQGQIGSLGLQIGQQIGRQISGQITAAIRGSIRDGITQGGTTARGSAARQGQQAGGEFARQMRARIEAALRAIPDITVGANTSEADADIQALRVQLESLASKRIGVDVDAADARAQVVQLEEELRRLGAAHPNPAVRVDTAAALAQLAVVREEIDRISADPARIRVETDGTFGQRLRAAVQQAQASLPNININADTTPAQIEVMRLRAQLGQLADQRVGIDIDAGTALARIEAIQARLEALAASDADIAVRVDSAAALAQLAAVRAMVDSLDRRWINLNVDTSAAMRALLQLSLAIGAVAAIPAVPVLAAGIGSIAAAATAAGAGVGAFAAAAIPALSGIRAALDAQKQAQDAATNAAARGGQASAQAAQRALQMAGAQQALAAAHRNAARQITQAERAVSDAVRQAAENNRRAALQVRQARQALADAVAQAAERQRAATERVADAEKQLENAQRAARQAQLDLTQARRDARMELEDLSNRLVSAQLAERDAALSVQEAQQRLAKVRQAGGQVSELEAARAQLAYEQAVQRLREQQVATKRLAAEKKAADKAGVEGSETVRRAQEALAAAQERVRDQAADVARAQQEAARQQVESTRAITAAQERVAEAQRNVAQVQRQGAEQVRRAQEQLVAAQQSAADSIASAQRQLASAQLSSAGAADQAAAAQAKYKQALAELSPAARGTFDAFLSLREAFGAWSRSLQPHIMPIFTRALEGVKNSLPGLTPFVLAAARAIETLQEKISKGFDSPWWREFRDDLAGSVEPALVGLGTSIGNIFKGMGGIIQAFLPHMDSISARMQNITKRFANWGTNLKGSPEFERFLAYASEQGPILADALGKIADAFYQVSHALAPLSGPVLKILGEFANAIAIVAEHAPWLVQGIWLAVAATKAWTLAVGIFNAVMNANPIVRIATLIGLLIAAVVYAYNRFGWFRTAVQAAWAGIQTAALWAWNTVLKPTFTAIWTGLQFVGRIALWLWQNAILPAFKGIWTVGKFLATVLAVLVVGPIVIAFRLLAAVGKWLWKTILEPAFRGIAAVFSWMWRTILKPIVNLAVAHFRMFAAVGKWLWQNALAPAFRGIASIAKWLWKNAIKPAFDGIASIARWLWGKVLSKVFDTIKKGVRLVADAFSKAKDGIGKAWGKLKDLTKKPIKWVIDWVYNKGVVGLWNAAASVLPIKKLKKFEIKGWAEGGIIPGYQPVKRDDILAPMRRGEGVLVPEVVRGLGADVIHELNAAGNRGGVPAVRRLVGGYATGGIVGDHGGIGDWIGGKVKAIGSVIGKAKDWVLGSVAKLAEAAAKPIRDLINRIPGGKTGFGQLARGLPTKVLNEALSFIKGSEQAELSAGGQWVKPVNAPFGTKFGVRGRMWASGRHTGLDFPAPLGAAVRAVATGRVSYTRSGGPYGKHILISHGGGLSSLYAHLSRILVKTGVRVRSGQRIGSVGATGNVTGPHLHLEARVNGRPVNPMNYLTGAAGGFSASAKGANQRAAKAMLSKFGWPPSQFGPLKLLWQHESGWNHLARNPSSGAYGIPQALPPEKMASAGSDWRTNPITQIKWGLGYIKSRYGSPAKAWAFWQRQSPHWYDSGGWLPEGLSLAYNGTGAPERVLTAAQERALMGAAARGAAAPSLEGLQVAVYVGDREITDIARAEVRAANGELLQTLRAK